MWEVVVLMVCLLVRHKAAAQQSCLCDSAHRSDLLTLRDELQLWDHWNDDYMSRLLCQWPGVACTGAMVTSLRLSRVGACGNVSNISALTNLDLTLLDLSGNPGVYGPIESLRLPQSIQKLIAGDTSVSGTLPSDWPVVWERLSELWLNGTHVEGELPGEWASWAPLRLLSLGNTPNISGTLPAGWAAISASLSYLDLSGTRLGGTIPTEWQTTRMSNLFLQRCSFSGTLAGSMFSAGTNLLLLNLSWNQFSGSLPPILNGVDTIDVSHNQLSGSLPDLRATSVKIFDASYNHFSDGLQTAFPVSAVSILLSHNKLTGPASPRVSASVALREIDLSFNLLEGNLSGLIASSAATSWTLNVAANAFSGVLPAEWEACGIMKLDASNNLLVTPLPLWSVGSIVEMDLSSNLLVGTLTAIPSRHTVARLILSGNMFADVGPLDDHETRLEFLDLSWNQLSQLPSVLPPQLRFLVLDGNSNASGLLPGEWAALPLEALSVGGTNASGGLPAVWGSVMRSLRFLNISFTHISGGVPLSWCSSSMQIQGVEAVGCTLVFPNGSSVFVTKKRNAALVREWIGMWCVSPSGSADRTQSMSAAERILATSKSDTSSASLSSFTTLRYVTPPWNTPELTMSTTALSSASAAMTNSHARSNSVTRSGSTSPAPSSSRSGSSNASRSWSRSAMSATMPSRTKRSEAIRRWASLEAVTTSLVRSQTLSAGGDAPEAASNTSSSAARIATLSSRALLESLTLQQARRPSDSSRISMERLRSITRRAHTVASAAQTQSRSVYQRPAAQQSTHTQPAAPHSTMPLTLTREAASSTASTRRLTSTRSNRLTDTSTWYATGSHSRMPTHSVFASRTAVPSASMRHPRVTATPAMQSATDSPVTPPIGLVNIVRATTLTKHRSQLDRRTVTPSTSCPQCAAVLLTAPWDASCARSRPYEAAGVACNQRNVNILAVFDVTAGFQVVDNSGPAKENSVARFLCPLVPVSRLVFHVLGAVQYNASSIVCAVRLRVDVEFVVAETLLSAAVETVAGAVVVAVVGPLAGAAAGAAQQSMLQLSLSRCEFSDTQEVSIAESPTRLRFGPTAGSAFRGAVVGNVALFVGVCGAATLGSVVHHRVRRTPTLLESLAALGLPGRLYIALSVILQPTVSASVALFLLADASAGDYVLGVFGVGVMVVCVWYLHLTCRRVVARLAPQQCDNHKLDCVERLVGPRALWLPIHPDAEDVKTIKDKRDQVIALFARRRCGRTWYFLVDVALATSYGVVGGTRPESESGCVAARAALAAVACLFFVVLVVVRPYASTYDSIVRSVLSAMSAASCVLMAAGLINESVALTLAQLVLMSATSLLSAFAALRRMLRKRCGASEKEDVLVSMSMILMSDAEWRSQQETPAERHERVSRARDETLRMWAELEAQHCSAVASPDDLVGLHNPSSIVRPLTVVQQRRRLRDVIAKVCRTV